MNRRTFIAATGAVGSAMALPGEALAADDLAPGDAAAIEAAARDYVGGFYAGDGARMERALHSELAKRIFIHNKDGSKSLQQMSAMTLVLRTREGVGKSDPEKRLDVRILDHFRDTACVRVDATKWVDYCHMAKVNGQWKIINVLWEFRAEAEA